MYGKVVKSFVRKNTNASERYIELGKDVDEHNWGDYIKTSFKKTVVAVMYLYLQEKLSYTEPELKTKGFGKPEKAIWELLQNISRVQRTKHLERRLLKPQSNITSVILNRRCQRSPSFIILYLEEEFMFQLIKT